MTSNCPSALQQGSSVFGHTLRETAMQITMDRQERPASLFRLILALLLCTGESMRHVCQMILESEQSALIPGAAGVSAPAPRPFFPPSVLIVIWILPAITPLSTAFAPSRSRVNTPISAIFPVAIAVPAPGSVSAPSPASVPSPAFCLRVAAVVPPLATCTSVLLPRLSPFSLRRPFSLTTFRPLIRCRSFTSSFSLRRPLSLTTFGSLLRYRSFTILSFLCPLFQFGDSRIQ